MKKRRKLNTSYLIAILSVLMLLLVVKIGGLGLLMILITLLIGIGAIYLSGESLSKEDVTHQKGNLEITVPAWSKDIAVAIEKKQ